MAEEILSLIKNAKSEKEVKKQKDKQSVWLIFTIGEKRFAIPAETVKEILRDAAVFPLPFVPFVQFCPVLSCSIFSFLY